MYESRKYRTGSARGKSRGAGTEFDIDFSRVCSSRKNVFPRSTFKYIQFAVFFLFSFLFFRFFFFFKVEEKLEFIYGFERKIEHVRPAKCNSLEPITRAGKSICFASILSKHGKWISVYSVLGYLSAMYPRDDL